MYFYSSLKKHCDAFEEYYTTNTIKVELEVIY